MVATVDGQVTSEVSFCTRCGERVESCVCARSSEVLEQLRDHARRAARAVEARVGQPASGSERGVQRSPGLAAVLSLVLPGLGQLYNGEVLKGIVFFLGWIFLVPWALAVMDAYYSARVSNLEERLRVVES